MRNNIHCVSRSLRKICSNTLSKPRRGEIIPSLRDLGSKPCKGDTLLTVGETEGATCGRDNRYILFVFHA
ncbi:MAG: hypothetical protein LBM08_08860 [Dysgonamonadaceae bacterium]|nr:hypothetical protein [Dysgonamonadaceae bacterium]